MRPDSTPARGGQPKAVENPANRPAKALAAETDSTFEPEKSGNAVGDERAEARLKAAKSLLSEGKKAQAAKWLKRIIDESPNSDAAVEAAELLKK